jgi:hypothetical protein
MQENIKQNIDLLKQIVESRVNIRKKLDRLTRNQLDHENIIKNTFKPLVDPLLKISNDMQSTKDIILTQNQDEKLKKKKESEKPEKISYDYDNLDTIRDLYNDDHQLEKAKETIGTDFVNYFKNVLDDPRKWDKTFGLRVSSTGWLLGDSNVKIVNDVISVNDITTPATDGLLSLLFLKNPDLSSVTENDFENYKNMLISTSAHRRGYSKNNEHNWNRGPKYVKVISKIFPKVGHGLSTDLPKVLYFNNYNELIERLYILHGSQQAGNDSVQNEILVITNRLKKDNIIS